MDKEIGKRVEILILILTLENIRMTRNMGMENFSGRLEVSLKVPMFMMQRRGMVKCTGWTGAYTVASGSMAYSAALG